MFEDLTPQLTISEALPLVEQFDNHCSAIEFGRALDRESR